MGHVDLGQMLKRKFYVIFTLGALRRFVAACSFWNLTLNLLAQSVAAPPPVAKNPPRCAPGGCAYFHEHRLTAQGLEGVYGGGLTLLPLTSEGQ